MFVGADLVGDKSTRNIQTGVLILKNKAPIHWYIKSQATVEASTFVEYFCAIKLGVEMVGALRYKLRIFVFQIDVSKNVFCDNEVF